MPKKMMDNRDAFCASCHSGSGWLGLPAALMLGGGDLTGWLTKTAHQPAPLTRPIFDETCLKCRGNLFQARYFNNHLHLFRSRWQSVDTKAGTCVSCHPVPITDGDATIAYLNQQCTDQVCHAFHSAIRE